MNLWHDDYPGPWPHAVRGATPPVQPGCLATRPTVPPRTAAAVLPVTARRDRAVPPAKAIIVLPEPPHFYCLVA